MQIKNSASTRVTYFRESGKKIQRNTQQTGIRVFLSTNFNEGIHLQSTHGRSQLKTSLILKILRLLSRERGERPRLSEITEQTATIPTYKPRIVHLAVSSSHVYFPHSTYLTRFHYVRQLFNPRPTRLQNVWKTKELMECCMISFKLYCPNLRSYVSRAKIERL